MHIKHKPNITITNHILVRVAHGFVVNKTHTLIKKTEQKSFESVMLHVSIPNKKEL